MTRQDEAGHKMIEKIYTNCAQSQISVIDIGDAKDVGDISDDQIREIWKDSLNNNTIAI